MTEIYRLTDVVRTYGRRRQVRAVDGVNLTVATGDRLGIVGGSGSGKSTLLRLMAALDRPSSGTISFDGADVTGLPERRLGFLRSRVQMVFQDPRSSLNPRMRVGEIITEPLRALRGVDGVPTDRSARLAELLGLTGLPADAGRRYPHEFSGGQRQRIAIARALAPRPAVLLADEPVSALDVSVRAHILNLLNDLVRAENLTLVMVTHDLGVVRHTCTSLAVMDAGRVVERGSAADVLARPSHPYTAELLAAVPTLPDTRDGVGKGSDRSRGIAD